MISFSSLDVFIIILFFASILFIGFYSGRKTKNSAEEYLLSGRKLSLFLFVLINVSTWYGGILGVGEFTYRYGMVSWFTQGLPYYFFAFLFAFFFTKKIREASLFTIPDKLTEVYGKKAGLISAVIVFVLVSPAPYLLMSANLLAQIFDLNIIPSLIIVLAISLIYLVKGGFRSNVYVDAFQFFVMFAGFILILVFASSKFGGYYFLSSSLPETHLNFTGGMPPLFLIVWFLIALWTFADPGFHQRCYAAKTGNIAKWGILISIIFWALFDFLTTSTGLFAKAVLPGLDNPVLSFPLFAEKVLPSGFKGIFYTALFATIISTQISFLFLSGTTIGRDFIFRLTKEKNEINLKKYTVIGLLISGIVAALLAYLIPSVIEIWYTIGSLFIPGIILPVISAYYPKLRVSNKIIMVEMIAAFLSSSIWYFIRSEFADTQLLSQVEPMIVGLAISLFIHTSGLISKSFLFNKR